MEFIEQQIAGLFVVESDVFPDARGSVTRAWVPQEFRDHGLSADVTQGLMAFNHRRGTIRGMHHQAAPFGEYKTTRVTRGAVFDVAVDLRPESPTYCQWFGIELSADNRRMLYIPPGCAHGYQTLADDTELFYLIAGAYAPAHQRGVRYNDPAFGIVWPLGAPTVINERDAAYADFVR
jgi:dTDP-4-dehydrorhamnose 3,5-epimerase